jgi:DNA-binding CsgD family transcriptional regulator
MNVVWQDELTPRERAVLAEARSGATTAEIAGRLRVAPSTVKSHLSSIYLKANVGSRAGALAAPVDSESLDLSSLGLSMRQQDVVRCLLRGQSNREIGRSLFLSPETVKDHLENIYGALGVKNRYELVALVTGTWNWRPA